MSTHSATAAAGPSLGLGHLEVLDEQLDRHAVRAAVRPRTGASLRTAFDTVRTVSRGSSSPNSHCRLSPVGSSA